MAAPTMVAALYVVEGGHYYDVPGVDPWPESRDATRYAGPHPVVAHPPCASWCRLAGLRESRNPELKRGEDGGTFLAALGAVRRYGGVLEHPAHSAAWARFGLSRPFADGGWQRCITGGWVCSVEQQQYGHPARKATWLYAHGVHASRLPPLKWSLTPDNVLQPVRWDNKRKFQGERSQPNDRVPLKRSERLATPHEFRDLLISIARSAGVSP